MVKPVEVKAHELSNVTFIVSENIRSNFCGGRFMPKRNSRNTIPICDNSAISDASATQPSTAGPHNIPSATYTTSNDWRTNKASVANIEAPKKMRNMVNNIGSWPMLENIAQSKYGG